MMGCRAISNQQSAVSSQPNLFTAKYAKNAKEDRDCKTRVSFALFAFVAAKFRGLNAEW
jgi:hypothetical protein